MSTNLTIFLNIADRVWIFIFNFKLYIYSFMLLCGKFCFNMCILFVNSRDRITMASDACFWMLEFCTMKRNREDAKNKGARK